MDALLLGRVTEENRTFACEDALPSLPLPDLKETLRKYLDSCKAACSASEYQTTKEIVEKFAEEDGPKLQRILETRARERRNWLEDWWVSGYLEYRGPLPMFTMATMNRYDFWKPIAETQLHRSALVLYASLRFWMTLREERIPQMRNNNGELQCMNQYKYIFNTCRVPARQKDVLVSYFKTLREGYSPPHMIILYKKRIYKISAANESGELLTPADWYSVLLQIKKNTAEGLGIALLTENPRNIWAEARLHLMKLSQKNAQNIHDIESAIFCFSLLDDQPDTDSDTMNLSSSGSYGDRWCDKLNFMCTGNGRILGHCEHTPVEGMVYGTMMGYNYLLLKEEFNSGEYNLEDEDLTTRKNLMELTFDLDKEIHSWVEQGRLVAQDMENKLKYFMYTFEDFGKDEIKKLNLHMAAFIQISMQLAYMRKHGKPGPTYETATTRAFYHGRTETIRSCTPEVIEFCQAMMQNSTSKRVLFQKAYEKYIWLMNECKAAKGCDRHLLGLAAISQEHGFKLPDLFTDPSYRKSGGGGNYVLSTSYSGVVMGDAGCAPMREDGYGVFFGTTSDTIRCCLVTYNPVPGVNAEDFAAHLKRAFHDVLKILQPAKL